MNEIIAAFIGVLVGAVGSGYIFYRYGKKIGSAASAVQQAATDLKKGIQ